VTYPQQFGHLAHFLGVLARLLSGGVLVRLRLPVRFGFLPLRLGPLAVPLRLDAGYLVPFDLLPPAPPEASRSSIAIPHGCQPRRSDRPLFCAAAVAPSTTSGRRPRGCRGRSSASVREARFVFLWVG
jgi:hypothetical protein